MNAPATNQKPATDSATVSDGLSPFPSLFSKCLPGSPSVCESQSPLVVTHVAVKNL